MTNEQMILKIRELCLKLANTDLSTARIQGKHAITGTQKGNLEVRYVSRGKYMILDFNNTNFAHYVGGKAGAVEFLANNYEVIRD